MNHVPTNIPAMQGYLRSCKAALQHSLTTRYTGWGLEEQAMIRNIISVVALLTHISVNCTAPSPHNGLAACRLHPHYRLQHFQGRHLDCLMSSTWRRRRKSAWATWQPATWQPGQRSCLRCSSAALHSGAPNPPPPRPFCLCCRKTLCCGWPGPTSAAAAVCNFTGHGRRRVTASVLAHIPVNCRAALPLSYPYQPTNQYRRHCKLPLERGQ